MSSVLRLNRAAALIVLIATSALSARCEILLLNNGDQYRGKVLGMNASNILFQSEVQGRVILPRNKVAQIILNEAAVAKAATNAAVKPGAGAVVMAGPPTAAGSPAGDSVTDEMRKQGIDPKIINEIQGQIFGKASPQAAAKFDELMNGVITGRLGVQDIRAEAQKTISQVKAMKKDLGDDAGDLLDGYVAILEKFVADSEDSGNQVVTPAKPAATPVPAPQK